MIGSVASAAVAGRKLSAQQIATRTGATLALTASLDRSGNQLRAVLTLTGLATGQQLWSEQVDTPSGEPRNLLRDAAGA